MSHKDIDNRNKELLNMKQMSKEQIDVEFKALSADKIRKSVEMLILGAASFSTTARDMGIFCIGLRYGFGLMNAYLEKVAPELEFRNDSEIYDDYGKDIPTMLIKLADLWMECKRENMMKQVELPDAHNSVVALIDHATDVMSEDSHKDDK
jgi:hypothetical protein